MTKPNLRDVTGGRLYRGVLVGSFALNLLVVIVLFTPLAESLYHLLYFTETPIPGQAIVVLPCELYRNGQLGINSLVRTKKSLQLYRSGYAQTIICAGGYPMAGYPTSTCQAIKKELLSHGVPEEAVLVDDESQNTYNDLRHLLNKYQQRFDFDQVLYVTSSYHTYRVRHILDKMNVQGRVVAAEAYQFHAYTAAERPLLFREIVREFLAIIYFWLRGYL